jgi:hypothetical protein
MVDFKAAAGGGGDGLQVGFVGADNEVAAAQRALNDACVNDVAGRGACC